MLTEISRTLLEWYARAARILPWRGLADPYAVWVSEIMLQQTQVDTVRPYFARWMEHFPTLQSLAQANEEEVLRLWEGLGYYSRARSLHRAARQVMTEYAGRLPQSAAELRRLPGIGPYTAGAVASIAFGQDEIALDGNIRRVLARLFNVELSAGSPDFDLRLAELAQGNLPPGQAGDFNQALMDLGATICTPKKPVCLLCPLAELCQARALGTQSSLPRRAPRPGVPSITVAAAVIALDGRVLLARRPPNGLLGGMWEFPGGKQEPGEDLPAALRREICEELDVEIEVGQAFGVYLHAYTHFKVTLHAFRCVLLAGQPRPLQASALAWAAPSELAGYPMGKIDRQIARRLEKEF